MAQSTKVNLDAKDAIKQIQDLKTELLETAKAISKTEYGSKAFKDLQSKATNLTHQIKALETEMQKTADTSKNMGKNVSDAGKEMSQGLAGVFGSMTMIIQSVGALGVNTKALTGSIGAVNKALLQLLKNPYALIIAAVVLAIKKLIDAIKGSEDRMNELKQSFSALNPIIDVVKRAFDALAKVVVEGITAAINGLVTAIRTVLGWLDKLASLVGLDWHLADGFTEASESLQELQANETQYIKNKRDWKKQSAKIDKEVAELRAKVADKEKYTAQERLEFLDQAIKLETQKAEKETELAKQNLANLEAEAARSENDAEMNEKLAEAEAAVTQAEASAAEATRRLISARATAVAEINADLAKIKEWNEEMAGGKKSEKDKQLKELEKTYKERLKIYKDNKQSTLNLDKWYEKEKKKIEEDAENQEKKDANQKQLDDLKNNYIQQQLLLIESLQKKDISYEEYTDKLKKYDEKYLRDQLTIYEQQLINASGLSEDEINSLKEKIIKARQELNKPATVKEEKTEEKSDEEKQIDTITSAAEVMEETIENLGGSDAWSTIIDQMQNLTSKWQEVSAAVKDKGSDMASKIAAAAGASLQAIGSVMSSVAADMDTTTEEGFEQQKKLQIAAAVVNMLGGIVSAWASAMNPANAWMFAPGQIAMGTAMTAATVAMGAAQIAAIEKQTFDSGSSSASTSTAAVNTTLVAPTQYSQEVSNANIEDIIGDTKVYVTESDIQRVGHKVEVAEAESRY